MKIGIEIPDDIAQYVQEKWPNVERKALEAFAADAARFNVITAPEVGLLLGFGYWERERFLRDHNVSNHMTLEEQREYIEAAQKMIEAPGGKIS